MQILSILYQHKVYRIKAQNITDKTLTKNSKRDLKTHTADW